MRILHVIPSLAPSRGGPTEAVLRMVEAQRAIGLDAEIATSDEAMDPVTIRGIAVRIFPCHLTHWPLLRDYAWCPSFAPWLWENTDRYDLLHVHALFSHLSTTAMRLARRAGVPYLIRPLGQLGRWPLRQAKRKKAIYLRLIERRNLDGAAALHFVSNEEKEEAADLDLASRAVVIPHGVKRSVLLPGAAAILRQELDLTPDRQVVLFLGRLHRKKGLDLLLRALALMPVPRPLMLVAGEGPEQDRLQQMAGDLHVADDVYWRGHVGGDWKELCLQGADAFALTSHHENFGMAVLEALAAGTPVLVSPHVALASIVTPQLGSVTALEPPAIATALCRLLASPDHRAARRSFIETNYSWEFNAAKLAALYRELVRKSR